MPQKTIREIAAVAPAKVNLFLGVSTTKVGGYHAVESVYHAIDLHDIVRFRILEGEGPLVLSCDPPVDVPVAQNLVTRAIVRLEEVFSRRLVEGGRHLSVSVEKHIPMQAGLAGGSTDAAAALVCGCKLLHEDPLSPLCLEVARSLGSDVPFFLYGGCAHMTGRGDVMGERLAPLDASLVIVNAGKAGCGVSTAEAYRAFDASPLPAGDIRKMCEALAVTTAGRQAVAAADGGKQAVAASEKRQAVAAALYNNLEQAAMTVAPQMAEHVRWLQGCDGVMGSLVSGSGSAAFALCDGDDSARNIAQAASEKGYWARATRTVAQGAHLL